MNTSQILSSPLRRRDWMRLAALGVGIGGASSSWLPALAREAAGDPSRTRAVILIWLDGGPSTIDMWDLKSGHANGGSFKAIDTAVPGIQIGEHLPKLAGWTKEMVLVRSMTSKEGDHSRATQFVKTGYLPQGAIQFPTIGSLVSHELVSSEMLLPGYVSIAPSRENAMRGGGFLGPSYSPFVIAEGASGFNAAEGPSSVEALQVADLHRPAGIEPDTQRNRLRLLRRLESGFAKRQGIALGDMAGPGQSDAVVGSLHSATEQAVRLMQPDAADAFKFESEPDSIRAQYGRDLFGQSCLLARRLIERQVPFVEVSLGGWDTHFDNFNRVASLCRTLDGGLAALLTDLQSRGLLESTLVVCMGEFGRTPKINGGAGRDHWPNTWSAMMAGGGIQGGQVIGKTNDAGTEVVDRPVTVPDLLATVCSAVGIDPMKQNPSNVDRPIRIADPTAKPVREIL